MTTAQRTVDEVDEWGAQFDGHEDAPGVGINKELLRKALSLNPKLRDLGDVSDVMKVLEKAANQRNVIDDKAIARIGGDLVTGLTQQRERYAEDKKRLTIEMGALQRQMQELQPKTLERVLEIFMQIDPNMTAITTQEMLKIEAAFLSEVGFSAKKIIEKKLKKR